jgi:hypothetical protein
MTPKLADNLSGNPDFFWITGPTATLTVNDAHGREILLVDTAGTVDAAIVRPDGSTLAEWHTRPCDRGSDELLHAVTGGAGATIALVHKIVPARSGGSHRLQIRAHRYRQSHVWDQLTVGVADAAVNTVRSLAGVGADADAVTWLTARLVLPAAPTAPTLGRVVAVAPPTTELGAPVPCRLRGGGIEAFLEERGGEWWVTRVRRAGAGRSAELVLLHLALRLVDRSTAASLREELRARITELGEAAPGRSFVRRWEEYQRIENLQTLREIHTLGCLEYKSWRRLDSDRNLIRFEIDQEPVSSGTPGSLLHHLANSKRDSDAMQLEAAEVKPAVLGGSASDLAGASGILDHAIGRRHPIGEVHRVDVARGIVVLKMITQADSVYSGVGDEDPDHDPPRAGFLFKSYRGDYRRLQRRRRAIDRVTEGRAPMPHLLSILEGHPTRASRPGHQTPVSQAVLEVFDGKINDAQRRALDIAVNTPDFAVIQGPPGTGKTELIAALQVRLAELGRSSAVISRSMMLTSYQHAAVDNLVERSKVWDLPAVKIDSQDRGSTARLESWREATVQRLRVRLAEPADGGLAEASRAASRAATSYRINPLDSVETTKMLDRLRDTVAELVSDDVLHRFDNLRTAMVPLRRAAALEISPRRESLRRAVRAVRYLPVSFVDDGPLMAAKLAVLLGSAEVVDLGLDRRLLDVVDKAAVWTGDETPDFLDDLGEVRGVLLDLLSGGAGRLARPTARDDVLALLRDVRRDLDERARTPAYGVQTALLDYLEDLQGDPDSVHSTLRYYTTSLGTTCQQADSRKIRDVKDGDVEFDTVIVDEAARANPLDLIIPLTMASRRVVLVGDHKQLPHMLEPDVERELRLREQDWAALLEESLFERLFRLFTHEESPRACTLNAQYRMHRVLGQYVSDNFYDSTLLSPQPPENFGHALPGYEGACAAWLSVPHSRGGETDTMSKSRPAEAKVIAAELHRLVDADRDFTFGVISFYSRQAQLICEELEGLGLLERTDNGWEPLGVARHNSSGDRIDRVQVGTVDAFQGKQFDVVLLSLTRSSEVRQDRRATFPPTVGQRYGHVLMPNRMCVAMSRQKKLLIMVGDEAMVRPETAAPEAARLTNFWRLCREHPAGRVRPAEAPHAAR